MKSPQAIIQLFSKKGLKITPQRRLIFELLAEKEDHYTAEELYQLVVSRMPDVSQTTVYNTLHELVSMEELVPLENLGKHGALFDTNTNHHHHLFCMQCHSLIDIDRDFPELELSLEETRGFQLVKNQVTFYGICQECQEEEPYSFNQIHMD
jgi:Fe2+ or Zn2+ uptake regulation protein